MNTTKYSLASVAAGVFFFVYGFVVHAMLLSGFYDANVPPTFMRPDDTPLIWAIGLSCILQGFALGYIFLQNFENKGIGEGVRFGFLIALFWAAAQLLAYGVQPVPFNAVLVSAIADGIGYVGLGAVFALVYKPAEA